MKDTIRESLKAKMLAAQPYQNIEVSLAELVFTASNKMSELIIEVELERAALNDRRVMFEKLIKGDSAGGPVPPALFTGFDACHDKLNAVKKFPERKKDKPLPGISSGKSLFDLLIDDLNKPQPEQCKPELKQNDTFETAVKPLINWLATHHNPHVQAIVTSTGAELVQGFKSFNTTEFIKD